MLEKSKRNAAKTKSQLTEAVSHLLRTKGFSHLRTNQISRAIDKDKRLIRYHYQSLNNLLKTFIAEKDYWSVLFEKFMAARTENTNALRDCFIAMMQENYDIFQRDNDMQNIIRWQISEENPLLKEISDSREEAGARLLELADDHFSGSGIDFRALMALILGGTYYVVLHSTTNKSVICGVNFSEQSGKDALMRTIAHIIEWAWKAAE